MDKEIDTIKNMKENGAFKKYIEYIVFPYYKNLVPGTKINLEFPITILVGKNGSGKSSTLHALYGAPYWKSCADFWFSTEVDPIEETGGEGKNRFFYGYREDKQSEIKEVMKTRMRRGSKTKEEDPDYWETSKPIKKDGMTAQTRNDPVKKEVVYLDFRAEVSAFDKIFHFAKGDISGKKDLLRKRSKYLNRLFNGEAMRFPGAPDEKVGVVKELNDEMKKKISSILGKEYVSIKVAEHSLFKNPGTSIYVKTKLSSRYSEANAGSGEVAVIQLVKKIEEAQEYSLILLDEPEVSIHPGAQEKLKEYLLEVTKRKKLQVVISSHSPILIRDMPSEAIKLYITNSQGRFEVKENVDYREAFYDLEDCVSDKKIIFCEDFAAKNIVEQVLKRMDKTQYFDVEFNPGGEKTLLTKYLPTFVTHDFFKERVFLVLDGDMQTDYVYNADELTVKQEKDVSYMKECVKKAYGVDIQAYVDGGNGGKREDQEIDAYKEYLKYYTDSVFYLPSKSIPEKILLESQYVKQQYPSIVNEKVDITNDNAKKIFATISEADYGNEEHINDLIQKLAYKWSMEDSSNKKRVEEIVNEIYKELKENIPATITILRNKYADVEIISKGEFKALPVVLEEISPLDKTMKDVLFSLYKMSLQIKRCGRISHIYIYKM